MRLFVLGATGAIGRHLLQIGLERGHQITAFVRSPDKISQRSGLLKVVQGYVFNADQLSQCLAGHDCVLSAFGPATLRATTLRRDFSRTLALALQNSKVSRAEIVSAAFLFPHIGTLGYILTRTLFRNMVPDSRHGERNHAKLDRLDGYPAAASHKRTRHTDLSCCR
jgi:uncharacterized protein YbjT (DUF2867 family)